MGIINLENKMKGIFEVVNSMNKEEQKKAIKDFAILLTCLLTDKMEKITGKELPSCVLEQIEKAFIDGNLNEVYDYYKSFIKDNVKEKVNE